MAIVLRNYQNLDQYDKKIIYELDVCARSSATDISKKVRLPKETVNFRIKRLLKNKYIKHFYAIINASPMGYMYYKIFLKYGKLTQDMEKKIIDYLLSEKSCANLRLIEGLYDMCFVTMHKNPDELREFLNNFNKRFGEHILQRSMHIVANSWKLNQKHLVAGKNERKCFHHGKVDNYRLDKTDLKIIKILSTKARTKLIELAREIKKNPKVIRYRLKRLEKRGIIAGYFTALNLELFARTFIQLDICLKDHDSIGSIIEFFDLNGICVFASEIIGKYDISLELYIESGHQLRHVLAQFKEKFYQHYTFYDISTIYNEYVINWSPFDAYNIHPKKRY